MLKKEYDSKGKKTWESTLYVARFWHLPETALENKIKYHWSLIAEFKFCGEVTIWWSECACVLNSALSLKHEIKSTIEKNTVIKLCTNSYVVILKLN